MKRKLLTLLTAGALALSLAACASTPKPTESAAPNAKQTDVVVFSAASMTESLTEIAALYKEVDPSVNLVFSFASSGDLKTQIQEGAECDLFISAGQKQMNQLDAAVAPVVDENGNATYEDEGLDFVDSSTRLNLLENKVTLCVNESNPAGIQTFDDLAAHLRAGDILFAMGNSDVPVGQYTQKIFAYYGLNEEELAASGVITYGTNVKEVTTQIAEATVDCGVIYCTDAFSSGLTPVDFATAEMCGQVIYPAAVLKNAPHADKAKAFLEYLQGPEAAAVFEAVGFTMVTE